MTNHPAAHESLFSASLIGDTYGKGRLNGKPDTIVVPPECRTPLRGSLDNLTGLVCTASDCPFPSTNCTFRRQAS